MNIFFYCSKNTNIVSSRQWLTILNKRLYEGAIDCASLCKLYCVSNTQWIVILCNWFFIGVNDRPLREIESIFVVFVCPKVQLFIRWCYWMLIYMQIAFLKVYLLSLIDRRCNCSSVDAKKNLGPRRGIGTMRGLYSSD